MALFVPFNDEIIKVLLDQRLRAASIIDDELLPESIALRKHFLRTLGFGCQYTLARNTLLRNTFHDLTFEEQGPSVFGLVVLRARKGIDRSLNRLPVDREHDILARVNHLRHRSLDLIHLLCSGEVTVPEVMGS